MPGLALPEGLLEHLRHHDRDQAVRGQSVDVAVGWWNQPDRNLPGGPVTGAGGTTGRQPITRSHIFRLADAAVESETGALRLLWHSLAWGTGLRHRNNKQRIKTVLADDGGASVLQLAAAASRHDAAEAFTILRAGHRNRFGWLGPNFFTKYLYFAGGGRPDHPCLIVDQFVRTTLLRETGDQRFRHISQYSVARYTETLEQLNSYAQTASNVLGRDVAGDEVERWAFGARAEGAASSPP